MLETILEFGRLEADAIKKGVQSTRIGTLPTRKELSMIKWTKEEDVGPKVEEIKTNMNKQFKELIMEVTH
jgi:V/A-type H+-transporting ATPase subunit A